MISVTDSSWRPVISGVPQGSTLGPMHFGLFNDNLDNGTDYILNRVSDNIKLGGVADKPDGCAAIQRNLDRLEK